VSFGTLSRTRWPGFTGGRIDPLTDMWSIPPFASAAPAGAFFSLRSIPHQQSVEPLGELGLVAVPARRALAFPLSQQRLVEPAAERLAFLVGDIVGYGEPPRRWWGRID